MNIFSLINIVNKKRIYIFSRKWREVPEYMQWIFISNKLDLTIFQRRQCCCFAGRLCSRRSRFGPCKHYKVLITSLTTTTPLAYYIFQHYMFKMESRHLRNLSVQNALDCISEKLNLKNFPGRACTQNSLEKCAVRSPDGRYRAHIATVCQVGRWNVRVREKGVI